MQNMFANLALTNQDHYIPRPFWNAFKDYDGQRLNLREHQDAYEFFTRLQVPITYTRAALSSTTQFAYTLSHVPSNA